MPRILPTRDVQPQLRHCGGRAMSGNRTHEGSTIEPSKWVCDRPTGVTYEPRRRSPIGVTIAIGTISAMCRYHSAV